ncbi:type VII secretion protein EssB [Evansella caseinilytica]|uniref:Type VII secretion protein EssB n=1 Tax=Evansella caseinilytica TaxID=1503961 RepID=A0A1H3TKS5_9BACI|nr:type VII secretion protein EssB [Evansella caseinilytica]SDZ50468.1 type VII secretion protein EssB [Evansella caseinilytica]
MKEKKVQFDTLNLYFQTEGSVWQTKIAKSLTQVKDIRQLGLMTELSEHFVPVTVQEEEDLFSLSFTVDQEKKQWKDVKQLHRNEKLRLLCNVAKLENWLSTRVTFFLHPENLVFDDNLMPSIIYRGIRDLFPPYEMKENHFLKQLKCFSIALLSKVHTFDDLYHGSLKNAKETEFERKVMESDNLHDLITYLEECYQKEQKHTEKTMELVPKKRFRLFKQLAIIMITLSVLLAAPLAYYVFVQVPYQDKLLTSHGHFLANDYGSVISSLRGEDAEKLPMRNKYILAYSYVQVEELPDSDKEAIMRNISLRSDENYLLYWIYNGRGNFEESIETAKYLDDPRLIMYGLIMQIEQAKNNPKLTGSEREEELRGLQDELDKYKETYIDTDEEELGSTDGDAAENQEAADDEAEQQETEEDSD